MAVDEIQTSHPGIFGPQGGHSRAVGIANMSWTLGIFFGPIISGPLADHVGYLEMNSVLGMYFFPLAPRCLSALGTNNNRAAILCLLSALNSYCNLGSRAAHRA